MLLTPDRRLTGDLGLGCFCRPARPDGLIGFVALLQCTSKKDYWPGLALPGALLLDRAEGDRCIRADPSLGQPCDVKCAILSKVHTCVCVCAVCCVRGECARLLYLHWCVCAHGAPTRVHVRSHGLCAPTRCSPHHPSPRSRVTDTHPPFSTFSAISTFRVRSLVLSLYVVAGVWCVLCVCVYTHVCV